MAKYFRNVTVPVDGASERSTGGSTDSASVSTLTAGSGGI